MLGLLAAAVAMSAGCTRHVLDVREKDVVLYLRAPGAREVSLLVAAETVEEIPAEALGFGLWRARRAGLHEFRYSFRVDGRIELPECPLRESDDFGSWNCVFDPHAAHWR